MKKKKFLGQNFLKNKKILEEMASTAELSKKDTVLEVGPGEGTLTEVLAEHAGKVVAIEKDRDLIPLLKEKFKNRKNVEIAEGDILRFGASALPKKYKVVANIPYYITSHFLKLFLSGIKTRPELMVLMVQKEVADRIIAKDGKESLLSLSVKVYGKPEFIRKVPRGAFSPPPNVDSAIIKISNISGDYFIKNKIDQKRFFEILRVAFQKKRKMLRQSIGKKIILPKDYETKRPEELSFENWRGLTKEHQIFIRIRKFR